MKTSGRLSCLHESDRTDTHPPGRVRDAILQVMTLTSQPLSVGQIEGRVSRMIGPTPTSSVRSYLRLNTPGVFVRERRGYYAVRPSAITGRQRALPGTMVWRDPVMFGKARLVHADCFDWLERQNDSSLHAVVTDPPYGLHEYTPEQQARLRNGKGGVWRLPPSFDGHRRSPLPRFTTLTPEQLDDLKAFFFI